MLNTKDYILKKKIKIKKLLVTIGFYKKYYRSQWGTVNCLISSKVVLITILFTERNWL